MGHQPQRELACLPQALGVVSDTHEAEGVDDPVAHGDALNDVEGHQGVPVPGDEGGVKVPQQGEAVVRRPTEDVGDQDQNQHHHCPSTPLEPLPDLLRLKTRNLLKPQLPGDLDVADDHDGHGAHELQGEDEKEVGAVENLLVHRPDLSTEGLVGVTFHMWVRCLRGHVGGGDGDEDGYDPDCQDHTARRLVLHTWLQRVEDRHVPADRERVHVGQDHEAGFSQSLDGGS